MLIIIGDWNTNVGNKTESNIVGNLDEGFRNEAGDRLMDICVVNNLPIANTCFKQLN